MALTLKVIEENPNGVLLYSGPSKINNNNIIVIATGLKNKSSNNKTGDMIQTWILNQEFNPIQSLKSGEDESVCGDCKHREFRSCYVNVAQAPNQVWKTWKNNKYSDIYSENTFKNRHIRIGSYGDPSAVPAEVWEKVTMFATGWTGYTHQWKKKDNLPYQKFCMASCDTYNEVTEAIGMNWRPFYVRKGSDPIPEGFFSCPASKEAGQRISCQRCGVCKGGHFVKGKGLPTIIAHGPAWKKQFFEKKIQNV